MKKLSPIAICALFAWIFTSCHTPNIAYFQDLSQGETLQPESVYDIKVKPEDKLSIVVSTQDAALSALLNLVQTQNRLSGEATAGHAAYSNDARVSYYTVDRMGDINFPVLGRLHIAGMKRSEVAEFIEKRLMSEDLVKQPVVTVEFINTGVSVLGEVARPGRYEFNRDRMTVIDAITMAGDLKNTGRRDNVMVIREIDGKKVTYVMDLTNARSVTSSPGYYLQQEDVIYVEPNDRAKRETTSAGNTPYSPSFWISVGSLLMTIATMVVTITLRK